LLSIFSILNKKVSKFEIFPYGYTTGKIKFVIFGRGVFDNFKAFWSWIEKSLIILFYLLRIFVNEQESKSPSGLLLSVYPALTLFGFFIYSQNSLQFLFV